MTHLGLGEICFQYLGESLVLACGFLVLQVCGFICMCISVDARQRLFIQVLPPGGGIFLTSVQFSSVQFSGSVVSDSL